MQVSCGPASTKIGDLADAGARTTRRTVLKEGLIRLYRGLPVCSRRGLRQGVPPFHDVAEAAEESHDAPMAPQTRNQVVFDWLSLVLD